MPRCFRAPGSAGRAGRGRAGEGQGGARPRPAPSDATARCARSPRPPPGAFPLPLSLLPSHPPSLAPPPHVREDARTPRVCTRTYLRARGSASPTRRVWGALPAGAARPAALPVCSRLPCRAVLQEGSAFPSPRPRAPVPEKGDSSLSLAGVFWTWI